MLYLFNWLRVSGLRVGQVVDGDGEEDVEQDVVAADEEDDEVNADNLAPTLLQIILVINVERG